MRLKCVRLGFILLVVFGVVEVIMFYTRLRSSAFQMETLDISLQTYNGSNHRDTVLDGKSCKQNVVLRNTSTSFNFTAPDWKRLKRMFNWLEPGGRYRPRNCSDPDRVAIIIPFGNRDEQLRIFLQNMHPFLKSQNIEYGVYVIEPATNATFNKAVMMNIGFVEASKRMDYQCYIFHDVDLLPRNEANLYICPRTPRHMAVLVDKFDYKIYYKIQFGGVTAFSKEHFQMVNGFSNLYFGWGGEDDDMFYRSCLYGIAIDVCFTCTTSLQRHPLGYKDCVHCSEGVVIGRVKASKLPISRYPYDIAKYSMIRHKRDTNNKLNTNRYYLLHSYQRFKEDGLNTLKYHLLDVQEESIYTKFLVHIDRIDYNVEDYTFPDVPVSYIILGILICIIAMYLLIIVYSRTLITRTRLRRTYQYFTS